MTAEAQWPLPSGSPDNSAASVSVPYPVTYAYLPNLAPGVSYTVTVSAVDANGNAVAAQPMSLVPLDPMPGSLAGAGDLRDVTWLGPGDFDKTGSAGFVQAAISGDGHYAFYFVEARSPLAPASVFDPASTAWYLVRESLTSPVTIQLASYGTDGNPVTVNRAGGTDTVTTNENGSAVAYDPGAGLPYAGWTAPEVVHDFTTNATWQIGPSGGVMTMVGVALNGTAAFLAESSPASDQHLYLQPMNGTAQQIDTCTSASGACVGDASMSNDGSEVAYSAPSGSASAQTEGIYLYSSATGSSKELFAGSQKDDILDFPVLSGDGTHIALDAEFFGSTSPVFGMVIVSTAASSFTTSDIVVPFDGTSAYDTPVSLSSSGSVLAYRAENLTEVVGGVPLTAIDVYRAGTTLTAPASADMTAVCASGGGSAGLTADGTELLYTECLAYQDNFDYDNFPGVYEWQLP